jgi:hypothetical protein
MTRRRALERWETKIANTFGLTFHPLEKAADCLENQFTLHDLCDENHKRQVEARVQTLLEAINNSSPEKIRPCDLQIFVNSLKLRKAFGIDGIPNECLRQLTRRPLVHLTHLINHCLRPSCSWGI